MAVFDERAEFSREFARLSKKWKSLPDDLAVLKKFLEFSPRGHEPVISRISGLAVKTEIFKVRHFRCSAMKGKGSKSGIRVIYAYLPGVERIEFVEIYYKEKDDRDCDRERIRKYYK